MRVNISNLNLNNSNIKKVYQKITFEEKIKNHSEMNYSCKEINFYSILRVLEEYADSGWEGKTNMVILSSHALHDEGIVHRDLHSKNMGYAALEMILSRTILHLTTTMEKFKWKLVRPAYGF
ncbi:kinase-like domain-containing protein [Rhizophagus clarus]|uniref:Kinase-like domain-containing protein n=1 Tax=Rhizophagus clarus TaxID=94130 RepID=A0A8H3LB65_9GLOM|nr:kinase-like domain-containing protein [Rhizophagus clarus]